VDALPDEIVVENVVVEDDLDANFGHQEVDFECLSMGSEEDPVLLTSSGDRVNGDCTKNSDWRGLFNSDCIRLSIVFC
jgi:hypothetical protein